MPWLRMVPEHQQAQYGLRDQGYLLQNDFKEKVASHFNLFMKLRPEQNGKYFANEIFKCIFFNEKFLNEIP